MDSYSSIPLKSCLKASQIHNIEGKTIGKDGKPMCAIRKPVRVISSCDENPNVAGDSSLKDKTSQSVNVTKEAGETSLNDYVRQPLSGNSFASVLQAKPSKRIVKIKELRNEVSVEGAAVAIPYEVVEEVSSRFTNTLYRYFIRMSLAFRFRENYVKNHDKYGLKRVQLHDDFFLFQFESKEGMDKVLENGPWTKDYTFATMTIKYEWKPPRCSICMIFNHTMDKCPKLPKEVPAAKVDDEGFMEGEPSETTVQVDTTLTQPKVSKPEVIVKNSFELLDEEGKEDEMYSYAMLQTNDVLNMSNSEVDEEILVEGRGDSNLHDVDVVVLTQDDQVIHTRVWLKMERKEIFCSFVYAHNKYNQWRSLWRNLRNWEQQDSIQTLLESTFNVILHEREGLMSGSLMKLFPRRILSKQKAQISMEANDMVRNVTAQEVKEAFFSIGDDKWHGMLLLMT
ncbi:hypothetical protein Tco_0370655 [Tanacetum coccineum]